MALGLLLMLCVAHHFYAERHARGEFTEDEQDERRNQVLDDIVEREVGNAGVCAGALVDGGGTARFRSALWLCKTAEVRGAPLPSV